MSEEIEKIGKVQKVVTPTGPAEEIGGAIAPNKDYFDALMKQGREVNKIEPEEANKASLMDEVHAMNARVDAIKDASSETLIAQVRDTISQIEEVKQAIATPNLDLKNSIRTQMRNKLSHIDDSLRVALSKANLEYDAIQQDKKQERINPVGHFLKYLTNGQDQLHNLSGELEAMQLEGKTFNPLNMLAVQVKVSYIQQEIEFFTSLLNKALESTKTIMNVQI